MNKYTITIFKGKWYAEEIYENIGKIGYDAVFTYALDETLDSGLITLYRSQLANAFPPYTLCRIDTYADEVKKGSEYWYILQDVVEQANLTTNTYNHTLSLIETTKVLERYLLPNNLTFTSTSGSTVYTIKDVINRCLNLIVPGIDKPFASADNFTAKAPDFNFSNRNLLEALMEIGRYTGTIPYLKMDGFEEAGNVPYLIEWIDLKADEDTNADTYSGINHTIPSTLYIDSLRSDVNNLVVKDSSSSYIWPAFNVYGYARSALGEELTSSNMELQLPEPIYYVEDMKMVYKGGGLTWRYYNASLNRFYFVDTGDITIKDIPVIENTVYSLLPTVHDADDTTGEKLKWSDVGKYQDTSLYFTSGQSIINIKGGYQYKKLFTYNSDVPTNILIAALNSNNFAAATPAQPTIVVDGYTYEFQKLTAKSNPYDYSSIDSTPTTFTFNTTYTPIYSGTITLKKEVSASSIPTNQQATIVDAEAWGTNLTATLNRSALPTTVKNVRNGTHTVGDKLPEGYIMAEEKHIGISSTTSAYTISRNYHRLSQYTALDSRWRETSVPTDGLVNRTFIINEALVMSDELNQDSAATFNGLTILKDMLVAENTISGYDINVADIYTYDKSGNGNHITLPASSISIGNCARFSFSFETNTSAGNAIDEAKVGKETKQFSKPIIYTDEDGYSKRITFTLNNSYSYISDNALKRLPEGNATTTFNNEIVNVPLVDWLKDSREIMAVNYNLHLLSNETCGFTNKMATLLPFISNRTGDEVKKFGFYLLRKPYHPNETPDYINIKRTPTINISHNVINITVSEAAIGWVAIDDDGDVIIYSNKGNSTMYISSKRETW